MPLYGTQIQLPENSIAYEYLKDELKALDVTFEDFNPNSKQLCFKGMYRKMLIKPTGVSFKTISHLLSK